MKHGRRRLAKKSVKRSFEEIGQPTSPDINVSVASNPASPAFATPTTASAPITPPELVAVSPPAIANACADYAMTSLQQSWALFGKLASARSPAEAFAFQMEFAKEARETFAAQSRKIADLHEELVRQRVVHFRGLGGGGHADHIRAARDTSLAR